LRGPLTCFGEAAATVAASLELYRSWEAVAKVRQLEERFAGVATDRLAEST
jgi:hypothetical protein